MKTIVLTLVASLTLSCSYGATRELVKQWETEPALKTPESVLYDATAKVLYVSNIDGREPWGKDGKGSIGKVGLDGHIIAAEWVTGLEAPKGLGLHAGKLYVADLDQVVVIDVASAKIERRIAVPTAKKLNDVTVDAQGVVYVSDSETGNVHAIREGKASEWLTGFRGVNGVLATRDSFYVLDDGRLFQIGKDGSRTQLVDGLVGHTDGIEQVADGEFIVSCWRGKIFSVRGGEKQLLVDSESSKIEAADIGYDPVKKIVYVPTFFTNTVVAYQLK